ncbi:hypothetical protein BXZ70DRAFT_68489 [Cristinia sonorae]|uniref:Uncharacterized protein n=1 Tax=Cristinia sonorae TaxID=1940300 RepID=A0A8K0XRF0_9AGAR|nr:hypothetical protein BXZ70DRAFT_68489 [Cristinia sonorae]
MTSSLTSPPASRMPQLQVANGITAVRNYRTMSPITSSANSLAYPPAAHIHTSNVVGTQPQPISTMSTSAEKLDHNLERKGPQQGAAERIRGGCIPCPDGCCFCIPIPCCC